ncbi:MAG TPA: nucleotide exchange factor GrpE, partial [Clostridium sp.]|nr:nucleotide exchange factor GrpE [Clostridium sp.]
MEENQELDKKDMEDNADEILENDPSEKEQNEEEGTSGEETSEVKEEDDKEDEMKKFRNRKEEIKELKEENDSLKDKLLRTVAEYDNFRKRTSKEKENIYTEACADVLKEILPVLDNLERAVAVDG